MKPGTPEQKPEQNRENGLPRIVRVKPYLRTYKGGLTVLLPKEMYGSSIPDVILHAIGVPSGKGEDGKVVEAIVNEMLCGYGFRLDVNGRTAGKDDSISDYFVRKQTEKGTGYYYAEVVVAGARPGTG